MPGFVALSDAAVGAKSDLLNFARYLDPLISILTNEDAQTPFTIGIFGPWGGGKSSLLRMLHERLETSYPDQFVCVNFNPWLYRDEPNLLVSLLHTLNDTLKQDKKTRFTEVAGKIGKVLLVLGADILLKHVTADTISIEKLQSARETLHKESGDVKSELRNLHNTLQDVVNTIHGKGALLVLFIDDLDRCAPDAIIDLLEAVKLFFDLEHTFIFLAIDKEVTDRGIEIKYSKFDFAKDRRSAIGAEYLEKMVQLPLTLFPLHHSQVCDFIKDLKPAAVLLDHLALMQQIVLPNPRKIKRILNIAALTNAIIQANPELQTLDLGLVIRLVVLQVQYGDLFTQVLRLHRSLAALERVYRKALDLKQEVQFVQFGEHKDFILKFCQQHYRPESELAALFKDSQFSENEAKLPLYLSMLGG